MLSREADSQPSPSWPDESAGEDVSRPDLVDQGRPSKGGGPGSAVPTTYPSPPGRETGETRFKLRGSGVSSPNLNPHQPSDRFYVVLGSLISLCSPGRANYFLVERMPLRSAEPSAEELVDTQ